MRRWGSDEWAAIVMLVVVMATALPVFLGWTETSVPRLLWSIIHLGVIGLLSAVAMYAPDQRDSGRAVTDLTVLDRSMPGRATSGHPMSARPETDQSTTDLRWRRVGLLVASVVSWFLLSTVKDAGLVPVLLVVIAALSAYVLPLRASLTLIAMNSVGLLVAMLLGGSRPIQQLTTVGFYLLIQVATMLSSAALLREKEMRTQLAEAHIQLRTASALIKESASTAERLRISRELHDVIGHQLTILTLELEAAKHRQPPESDEHIERADSVARDLLRDVRKVVSETRNDPGDLHSLLGEIVADLPGLTISLEVNPQVRSSEQVNGVVARAVQEIVTNAVRHSSAKELWFSVRQESTAESSIETSVRGGRATPAPTDCADPTDCANITDGANSTDGVDATTHTIGPNGTKYLVVESGDDGVGAVNLQLGNGLRGMIERVSELGGEVRMSGLKTELSQFEFAQTGSHLGFHTEIRIPL